MPRPRGVTYNNQETTSYFLSTSVVNAVNDMKTKIDSSNTELMEICNIVNPYQYVFSSISESAPTLISKINTPSNFYYELREIINSFGFLRMIYSSVLYIGENIKSDNTINLLFTSATTSRIVCTSHLKNDSKFDIAIMTISSLPYIKDVLASLNIYSPLIIKISNITNKESVNTLYFLSMTFEKVYMVKPSIVNIFSDDIFIVCISLIKDWKTFADINLNIIEIPNIFLTKIEEFNSINGHVQLDAYDQVFNMFYNKNRTTKMDILKKSNIQKSQLWCDKNNIPYNKLGDRVNIFL
jgi:hypothetical protein